MYYLKNVLVNFLIVFFANYLLPGIDVVDMTKIPHFGGDLMFAAGVGLLNASVCFLLKLFRQQPSLFKAALFTLILNFVCYGVIKWVHVGIDIMDIEGYFLGAGVVSVGSILVSYFDLKRSSLQLPG